MKYKKFKIVFADPTGDSGWHTDDEIEKFIPEECIIEGYVFSKDKKYIKTFASYSTTANDVTTFGDVNVLPVSCVLSIKPIK